MEAAFATKCKSDGADRVMLSVLWTCRLAVAVTWLYNGLWLKLFDDTGRHAMIVARATGLSSDFAVALAAAIGVVECVLALAVITGRRPWLVCVLQVVGLIVMNAGGLLRADNLIDDVPRLLVGNFAFLSLVFAVAYLGDRNNGCKR